MKTQEKNLKDLEDKIEKQKCILKALNEDIEQRKVDLAGIEKRAVTAEQTLKSYERQLDEKRTDVEVKMFGKTKFVKKKTYGLVHEVWDLMHDILPIAYCDFDLTWTEDDHDLFAKLDDFNGNIVKFTFKKNGDLA